MTSILIVECVHEVCSFNPVPTRNENVAIQRWLALFAYHLRPSVPLDAEVPLAARVRASSGRGEP